jgi:hypothetical protein
MEHMYTDECPRSEDRVRYHHAVVERSWATAIVDTALDRASDVHQLVHGEGVRTCRQPHAHHPRAGSPHDGRAPMRTSVGPMLRVMSCTARKTSEPGAGGGSG